MEKGLKWEEVNIGDRCGPIEYVITSEMIDGFASAVEDYNDWYMKGSPFNGRIAHPTLTASDQDVLLISRWGSAAGLHAKQSSEFINPARLGKKITVTGVIVDKYIKREKHYLVLEYLAIDEDGREIVRHRKTDVYLFEGGQGE